MYRGAEDSRGHAKFDGRQEEAREKTPHTVDHQATLEM